MSEKKSTFHGTAAQKAELQAVIEESKHIPGSLVHVLQRAQGISTSPQIESMAAGRPRRSPRPSIAYLTLPASVARKARNSGMSQTGT